jgi:hypothetical protein
MEDMFRMTAEENARRFYFDPDRARRRLEAIAKADPRLLVRNRSTVVRLSYPAFVNPELAKWLHRVNVPTLLVGVKTMASCRHHSPRLTGPAFRVQNWR